MKHVISQEEMNKVIDNFVNVKKEEFSYAYTSGFLQSTLIGVLDGASKEVREIVYRNFKQSAEKSS